MKTIIGMILISLATTACSQTVNQTPDKEQVAVNEIQSDLNAADAAVSTLDKEGIYCTVSRRTVESGKDKALEEHSFVSCTKEISPTNKPKGQIIDHEWTAYSTNYWQDAIPEAHFSARVEHCVGKKSC